MQTARSYRCHYNPNDRAGWPVPCETGVLPFIELKASDAEDAQRKAFKRTGGCSISHVERLERDEKLLDNALAKAKPRRFTGAPITDFGALA